jgi:hypothetical protein
MGADAEMRSAQRDRCGRGLGVSGNWAWEGQEAGADRGLQRPMTVTPSGIGAYLERSPLPEASVDVVISNA